MRKFLRKIWDEAFEVGRKVFDFMGRPEVFIVVTAVDLVVLFAFPVLKIPMAVIAFVSLISLIVRGERRASFVMQ